MDNETISGASRLLENLRTLIEKALQAGNTRDITTFAGYAQAATVELKDLLQDSLDSDSLRDVSRGAVGDAIDALSQAAIEAEKVALGTDVPSMHERVEVFKRALDHATSQTREALQLG